VQNRVFFAPDFGAFLHQFYIYVIFFETASSV